MSSAGQKTIQLSIVLLFLAAVARWLPLTANSQSARSQQGATINDWRPHQLVNNAEFLGAQACAECHRTKVASQTPTHMGKALILAAEADILRRHPKLTYRQTPYFYQIARQGNRQIYTVTDGTNSITVPLLYCFGSGEAGQTYVLQYDGRFYEGRVSFYNDIDGLDITMGHQANAPKTLIEAMGREMSGEETRNCFACHTTNTGRGKTLHLDQMMAGVTCEACHGPGQHHVAAMKAGAFDKKQIFNPQSLSTEDLANFCGACHRSWEQIALLGPRGITNVRFQPYRLTNSKCYDTEDKRISCTACHDPHEARHRDAAFYDAKCLACHKVKSKATATNLDSATQRVAPLCKVGRQKCSSCHMPKIALPGAHFQFSDHYIRIVREGEAYPN
ncbi:MAG: hypothetical protein HY231_17465 [Acidobacteria bacterium]|nr:hypothetical protein [Acidobacteriota bacterium]